jgi:Fe-S oxidoreductase
MKPIAMTLLLLVAHAAFAWSALRRFKLLRIGAPANRFDHLLDRLTTAPGEKPPSMVGRAIVGLAGLGLVVAPVAALAGFPPVAGVSAAMAGAMLLLWAIRMQIKMPKYPLAGLAHLGIFTGFAVLLLRTLVLVGRGYAGEGFNAWVLDPWSSDGTIALAGRWYNHLKDVVVLTVLFGVGTFVRFRLIDREKRLAYGWHAWVVLGVIATMMVSDVLYDAGHLLSMALRGPGEHGVSFPWDEGAPLASLSALGWASGDVLGALLARGLGAVVADADTAHTLGQVGYWVHVTLVFAFLNYLPYGKHFHVITALPNVVTRSFDPAGRLRPMAKSADALMEDMGKAMELPDASAAPIGVARMNHFTWKSILDFYTCTECGRCSDNCPAHRTGKLLSPKHFTIDLRDHLYSLQDAVVRGASATPAEKAQGEGPTTSTDAGPFSVNLVPDVIHPDVLWACTTCRACEEQCPVMITYVDKIVDMRRNLVMLRGEFPAELQKTFTALETNGNPWNITRQDRAEWAAGLDVPLMADTPDAEVLYWVGCAASYDDRAKKIARATVKLLRKAGVKFAILGTEETCTGDPARRAGNEHLYLTLAEQNVATLNAYKPRKIVTTCPHCFNTLLNEYPDLGARYEVVHHTDYLLGLLAEKKLVPTKPVKAKVAYHDSCYLGRYNDVYEPPRKILQRIAGVELVEAEWSREKGLCCGAGGAQMWMEEQHGTERVNRRRTLQLVRTGASVVATGCPFCQTMLTDGIKGMEEELDRPVEQLDVAELLERAVEFGEPAGASHVAEPSMVSA